MDEYDIFNEILLKLKEIADKELIFDKIKLEHTKQIKEEFIEVRELIKKLQILLDERKKEVD